MQVYQKFGIMTAKPSEEEMAVVSHRLYDYVDINSTDYSVKKWISDVENEISCVLDEGKLPIICGGTCNYIKSLIFQNQLDSDDLREEVISVFSVPNNYNIFFDTILESQTEITKESVKMQIKEFCDLNYSFNKEEKLDSFFDLHEYLCLNYWNLDKFANEDDSAKKQEESKLFDNQTCFSLLSIIDPKISSFLSEKDRRRVFNALRKFYRTKGLLKEGDVKSTQNLSLRFPSLIFLLKADHEILEQRISKRIDKMLFDKESYNDGTFSNGIIEIVELFNHFCYSESSEAKILNDVDFEKGILQSIGYKEFYPLYKYILANCQDEIKKLIPLLKIGDDDAFYDCKKLFETKGLCEILSNCKENLRLRTVQYAKYQSKYLNKKICRYLSGSNIFIEILLNDAKKYEEIALKRVKEFIDDNWGLKQQDDVFTNSLDNGRAIQKMMEEIQLEDDRDTFNKWKKYVCTICGSKIINGESSYQVHIKSKGHCAMRKKAAIKLAQEEAQKEGN